MAMTAFWTDQAAPRPGEAPRARPAMPSQALIDHYVAEGRRQRSEVVFGLFGRAFGWLRRREPEETSK